MIVITLTKVPPSLRGDLTKWYQEIQTGVYVGNVSARVRDQLWDRVMRDIGNGQATMVYNAKNEFGYQFKTTRKDRRVVDFDDIPLMKRLNTLEEPVKLGFSNASKYHRARLSSRKALKPEHPGHSERSTQLVAIDIETTGLDAVKNQIISIAAFKSIGIKECQHFDAYISIDQPVPENIVKLTGITDSKLKDEGIELVDALRSLKKFVGNLPIVGYNLEFDDKFISLGFKKYNQSGIDNKMIDLMPLVKKANRFLDNFRLNTVLKKYDISNEHPHEAYADAQATLALAEKLIKNGDLVI